MAIFARYLLLFALQCLSVYGDILVATVPNLVRAGDTETVLVTIHKDNANNARDIPVTVIFKNADNTIIDEVTINIQEAGKVNSVILPVYVNPENIPSTENDEEVTRYITVTVTCDLLGFSQDKQVLLSLEGGFFFIQTDKPIYTPKQTVKTRLISLDKRMSPLQQEIKLDIRTPQDVAVNRKVISPNKVINGVHTYIFPLPEEPMFGNWSIVAYYGKDMKSNRTVQFEVKEYLLPTFFVEIRPPNFLLKTNDTIRVDVDARYVYDKPVKGRSILKIGVIDPDGEIETKGTPDTQSLVDGHVTHTLNIDILGENWFQNYLGCSLYMETTVWEDATGHFENTSDSSTKIVDSPYIFSREKTMAYFKAGLPFQVKTDLKYINGNPAPRVPVSVVAEALLSDGTSRNLREKKLNAAEGEITDSTDTEGRVNFNLYVPNDCTEITVTLTTQLDELRVEGNEHLDINANLPFVLQPYESPDGGSESLVIRPPLTTNELRAGNKLNLDIYLERIARDGSITIYVISRGKIVHYESLEVGNIYGYELDVTYEMIPSARIVAYFIGEQNRIIADSVMVEVQRECENTIHVSVDVGSNARPNDQVELRIAGKPGTTVSLLAVDQAVLRLRDFHRLTRDKMYSTMDMHDIGCGPGGGRNSENIFKNAGVTVMVTGGSFNVGQREGAHCVSNPENRRRRSLEELLEEFGGDAITELSCKRGHRRLGTGSCTEKAHRFRERLLRQRFPNINDEVEAESVGIFIACCERAEGGSSRERAADGFNFAEFAGIVGDLDDVAIRQDFRESWAFDVVHLDSIAPVFWPYTLPGSITTWSIQAFGLNDLYAMCIIEPRELIVSSDLFIQLKMPYSVIRNEHVEIQATVFNYGKDDLAVRMFLKTPLEICSEGTPNEFSAKKEFIVKANDAFTVTYVVIGVEVGEWPINILIVSTKGSDGIIKKLNVVAEGVERTFHHSIDLNPREFHVNRGRRDVQISNCPWDEENRAQVNCLDISLPPTVVPGTESCHISMSGTALGPAITAVVTGLGRWVRLPGGCGEQTMIALAPQVYVLTYLRNTESGNEDVERTALSNIQSGIVREITYRHPDGSFAAFHSRPGSTWLTAFVGKVFCQASELTAVDSQVTCGAMEWITSNRQRDNGAFYEGMAVIHREMTGGINGDIAMTAFALIAMTECSCDQQAAMDQAKQFLESQIDGLQRPYTLAVVTYALALVQSDRRFDANSKLRSHSSEEPATNSRAWGAEIQQAGNEQPFWHQRRPSALSVETTGYALLAQIALNEYAYARNIANWLSRQQNYGGGFVSTQDTVIALQSLSKFSALNTGGDLDLQCNITAPHGYKDILRLKNEDLLLQKTVKVPKESIQGQLLVKTQGDGIGTLNVEVKYNDISHDQSEVCPFDMVITTRRTNRNQPRGEEIRYEVGDELLISIVVSYLGDTQTSMAIIDFGLFTGFVPVINSCQEVVDQNGLIARYEVSDRSVIFYADHIPVQRDGSLAFEFKARCEFSVTNIHHAAVKVYDYYDPAEECIQFYSGEGTNVVKTLCNDDQCTCLSSECPACDMPMESIELLDAACASAQTYAFKMTVTNIQVKDGYKIITATIDLTLKRGDEQDVQPLDSREFWMSSACKCPRIRMNREYLIIGSNSLKYTLPQGNAMISGYRYVIDNTAIVKRWRNKLDTEVRIPIERGQTRCL